MSSTRMETYGGLRNTALKGLGLDAIYIPHYTKYPTRKAYMQKWLDAEGLEARFVTGFDREEASDEDLKCMYPSNRLFETVALQRRFWASWLEVRELTVGMKHAAAWYDAMTKNHRHVLILEDDSIFSESFTDTVKGILGNKSFASAYDILFLGSYYQDAPTTTPRLAQDIDNRGAVAYLLSRAGMEHLLSRGQLLTGPIDHVISNGCCYPNPPPRRWSFRPWPVWQGTRLTTREARRFPQQHDGRAFIWTGDLGRCEGPLCPRRPAFGSEVRIVDGDTNSSLSEVRIVDGDASSPLSAVRIVDGDASSPLGAVRIVDGDASSPLSAVRIVDGDAGSPLVSVMLGNGTVLSREASRAAIAESRRSQQSNSSQRSSNLRSSRVQPHTN